MFDGAERRFEGLKATLSFAAVAAGILLSNMAAHSVPSSAEGKADVVGVWGWVATSKDAATPVFEIRRNAAGELTAKIVARSGGPVHGADVSYEAGRICMVTEDGASFKGTLSEDGTRIHGVIRYGNTSASALLERIEHRKLRRAAARQLFAT